MFQSNTIHFLIIYTYLLTHECVQNEQNDSSVVTAVMTSGALCCRHGLVSKRAAHNTPEGKARPTKPQTCTLTATLVIVAIVDPKMNILASFTCP